MLLFWVVLAVLTCAATTVVAWPLLAGTRRADSPAQVTDEARRLAVYRDRRREIEAERDSGRLTADEASRSLDELAAEAAAQFGTAVAPARATPAPAGGTRASLVAAIVAALLVPAAALVLYGQIGSPELVAGVPATDEPSAKAVDRAIAELNAKVRKNPDDGAAWASLGEAYRVKGDLPKAASAYEKAVARIPDSARLLADCAEVLAMAAGGRFEGRPVELLEKALQIDPTEVKSMVIMGFAQYRLGNTERGLKLMRSAVDALGEDSQEGQQIAQILARMESESGLTAPKHGTGKAAPAAQAASNPAATVSGTVTIDDSVRKNVPEGAVLFVSARVSQGPRMPLAAVRLAAAGPWPQTFELSDAQAMDKARLLSGAKEIVIDALVSGSGNPMRQSGDFFGTSVPVKPGARGVTVKIDQRVP
jgi:cytochrome c-type biogenesis protein CcmH